MIKVYILLPIHNRKAVTKHFIDCLRMQSYQDYHLILIDDGSTDGTAEMVSLFIDSYKLTIIKGRGDWWWAGSLQQGLDWLKKNGVNANDLILFINDDVGFSYDYLDRAIHVMADRQDVLMLSRHRLPDTGNISESGVFSDLKRHTFTIADSSEKINCLSTRGLFTHWAVIQKIGDFHPRLLPHYWSDYEYTIRAHQKGIKCETSPDIVIVPNHETTGLRGEFSEIRFTDFLKKYFSRRSISNPLYVSAFLLLTSRPQWMLSNLLRVWVKAGKTIFRAWRDTGKLCPRT